MFVSRPSLGAGGGRGGKGRGGPRGRMAGPARRPPPVRGGSRPPHGAGGAGSGARAKGSQGGTRPARRRGGAGDGGGGQGRGTGAGAAGRPGVGRVGARRTSPAAAPEGTGCASIIAMGMMMAGVLDSLLGSCPLGDRGGRTGGAGGRRAGAGRAVQIKNNAAGKPLAAPGARARARRAGRRGRFGSDSPPDGDVHQPRTPDTQHNRRCSPPWVDRRAGRRGTAPGRRAPGSRGGNRLHECPGSPFPGPLDPGTEASGSGWSPGPAREKSSQQRSAP